MDTGGEIRASSVFSQPEDATGLEAQGHEEGTVPGSCGCLVPCTSQSPCDGDSGPSLSPTFLCLVAVDPHKAFRADAEEGGLVDAGQAGAPVLTVVDVAEVTCQQSHMSPRAINKAHGKKVVGQSPKVSPAPREWGWSPCWALLTKVKYLQTKKMIVGGATCLSSQPLETGEEEAQGAARPRGNSSHPQFTLPKQLRGGNALHKPRRDSHGPA